jgi:DNA-binding beta-propeller fold protein YncE
VFDLRTNKLVKTVGIQARGACCVYATPDQRHIYNVGGLSAYITAIDTKSLRVTHVIPFDATAGDHGSVIAKDGKMFWFDDGADILGVDVRSNKVAKVFKGVGGLFQNSRDGRWLFQDNTKGAFTVRDTTSGTVVAQTSVPYANSGSQAVMVSPDGRTAYIIGASELPAAFSEGGAFVSSYVEVVDVRNPRRPRFVATIRTGSFPEIGTFTPDGRELWLPNAGDGTITVVDVRTNRILRLLSTGRNVNFVNFYGDRVYVSQNPYPVPPNYATAFYFTAAAVIPGAALSPTSGSSSYTPGVDAPGEIAIYDRRTFKQLDVAPLKLPSEAFVSDVVMAPA